MKMRSSEITKILVVAAILTPLLAACGRALADAPVSTPQNQPTPIAITPFTSTPDMGIAQQTFATEQPTLTPVATESDINFAGMNMRLILTGQTGEARREFEQTCSAYMGLVGSVLWSNYPAFTAFDKPEYTCTLVPGQNTVISNSAGHIGVGEEVARQGFDMCDATIAATQSIMSGGNEEERQIRSTFAPALLGQPISVNTPDLGAHDIWPCMHGNAFIGDVTAADIFTQVTADSGDAGYNGNEAAQLVLTGHSELFDTVLPGGFGEYTSTICNASGVNVEGEAQVSDPAQVEYGPDGCVEYVNVQPGTALGSFMDGVLDNLVAEFPISDP